MSEEIPADPQSLLRLATAQMPYGRYQGRLLIDLPEPYVVWLVRHQLPDGELGQLLQELYEIKVNGLESLLRSLHPGGGR